MVKAAIDSTVYMCVPAHIFRSGWIEAPGSDKPHPALEKYAILRLKSPTAERSTCDLTCDLS